MKKVFAAILAIISLNAFATDNSVTGATVTVISVRANNAFFSVTDVTPANVCNHYGYDFNLDISTPGGKNLYTALLTAKLTGGKINMVYTESTTPGVVNCAGTALAKPWVIDLQ